MILVVDYQSVDSERKVLEMNSKSQGSYVLEIWGTPRQLGFTLGSSRTSEKQELDLFPSPFPRRNGRLKGLAGRRAKLADPEVGTLTIQAGLSQVAQGWVNKARE